MALITITQSPLIYWEYDLRKEKRRSWKPERRRWENCRWSFSSPAIDQWWIILWTVSWWQLPWWLGQFSITTYFISEDFLTMGDTICHHKHALTTMMTIMKIIKLMKVMKFMQIMEIWMIGDASTPCVTTATSLSSILSFKATSLKHKFISWIFCRWSNLKHIEV